MNIIIGQSVEEASSTLEQTYCGVRMAFLALIPNNIGLKEKTKQVCLNKLSRVSLIYLIKINDLTYTK